MKGLVQVMATLAVVVVSTYCLLVQLAHVQSALS